MYFDNNDNLITFEDDNQRNFIPGKHVRRIHEALKSGKPFHMASPIYLIDKEQAGEILKHFQEAEPLDCQDSKSYVKTEPQLR